MWDWELLKNGSNHHQYHILEQYKNESFQFMHAISSGTERDVFCLHNHAMYELVYCVSGDVAYMVDGTYYNLKPDTLLIISPSVLHRLFVHSSTSFERYILYVNSLDKGSPLSRLIVQCQQPIGEERISGACYHDMQPLRHMLVKLGESSKSADKVIQDIAPLFAQGFLAELLMSVRERKPDEYSVGAFNTVDFLKQYLSKSFTQAMTLQDVADRFHLNKDYCNRLFHRETGMSIMQYISYNRIFYARQLLVTGLPAADVAKKAGFSDYSTFYRTYRRITGRTPHDDYKIGEEILHLPEEISFPTESIDM